MDGGEEQTRRSQRQESIRECLGYVEGNMFACIDVAYCPVFGALIIDQREWEELIQSRSGEEQAYPRKSYTVETI